VVRYRTAGHRRAREPGESQLSSILGICRNDGVPSSKAVILAQAARERGGQPAAGPEASAGGIVARAGLICVESASHQMV